MARYLSSDHILPTPPELARQVEKGKCVTMILTPEQNRLLDELHNKKTVINSPFENQKTKGREECGAS